MYQSILRQEIRKFQNSHNTGNIDQEWAHWKDDYIWQWKSFRYQVKQNYPGRVSNDDSKSHYLIKILDVS